MSKPLYTDSQLDILLETEAEHYDSLSSQGLEFTRVALQSLRDDYETYIKYNTDYLILTGVMLNTETIDSILTTSGDISINGVKYYCNNAVYTEINNDYLGYRIELRKMIKT